MTSQSTSKGPTTLTSTVRPSSSSSSSSSIQTGESVQISTTINARAAAAAKLLDVKADANLENVDVTARVSVPPPTTSVNAVIATVNAKIEDNFDLPVGVKVDANGLKVPSDDDINPVVEAEAMKIVDEVKDTLIPKVKEEIALKKLKDAKEVDEVIENAVDEVEDNVRDSLYTKVRGVIVDAIAQSDDVITTTTAEIEDDVKIPVGIQVDPAVIATNSEMVDEAIEPSIDEIDHHVGDLLFAKVKAAIAPATAKLPVDAVKVPANAPVNAEKYIVPVSMAKDAPSKVWLARHPHWRGSVAAAAQA